MTDLSSLISKLEQAKGPDRELDLEIAQTLAPDIVVLMHDTSTGKNNPHTYRQFTDSIDCAVWLCERVLPGWNYHVGGCPKEFLTDIDRPYSAELMGPVTWGVIDPEVGQEPIYDTAYAQAHTAALAVTAAVLRAKQAMEAGE